MTLDHSAKAFAVLLVRQWLMERLFLDWLKVIRFELTETEIVFDLTMLTTTEYRRFLKMLRMYLMSPVEYDGDYSYLEWQEAHSYLPIELRHFREV
jgi:hypothetical protein